jgi:hypothetical protein
MSETFNRCTLPWRIWPWGISLRHSDSDMVPECSVEFGAMIVRPTPPYEELWVKVDFELAAFASAKPHRDDEELREVSGYDIIPRRNDHSPGAWQRQEKEWLGSGVCSDPGFYFSTNSRWLELERDSWAARQRTSRRADEAIHFLLDGRDGYLEILAAGFTWRAWRPGRPMLNDVSGEPTSSGAWADGNTS